MEKKKATEEQKKDIWADPDLGELLFASEVNRDKETVDPTEGKVEDEEVIEEPDTEDPDLAHELYHQTLQPLLRAHLKRASLEARKLTRAQVNLLLKDGHEKGRDGKQGYQYRMEQAISILQRWERMCNAKMIPPTESKFFRLFAMMKEAVDAILEQRKQQEGKATS